MAAGSLLLHRPAHPRLPRAVPVERAVRPRLVRLFLHPDGVDRSLHVRSSAWSRATAATASSSTPRRGTRPRSASAIAKHGIWLLIAWWTGGAWVLYFADAPTLVVELATLQAPLVAYVWIGILTFTTYYLAGHMREQVCLYMCPWPRIQAALTDVDALNVTYRRDRGEPRLSVKDAARARARRQAGRRLHRLPSMRRGLPDRRRHPQGLAARLHPVRPVHRRLRRGDGQGPPADPAHRLRHRREHQAPRRAARRRSTSSCVRAPSSTSSSSPSSASLMVYKLTTRQHMGLSVLHVRAPMYTLAHDGGWCATATPCASPTSGASRTSSPSSIERRRRRDGQERRGRRDAATGD